MLTIAVLRLFLSRGGAISDADNSPWLLYNYRRAALKEDRQEADLVSQKIELND